MKIKKGTHLKLKDSIDANQIGPSLEYVKRWAPEKWKLALFGKLHIISQNDFIFIQSCIDIMNTPKKDLNAMGRKGRKHVKNNYDLKSYVKNWDSTLTEVHESFGSWENRRNYKNWSLTEL